MRICRPAVAAAPFAKLPYARFEHLVGVKARVLAQQHMGERRDQRLRRVPEDEVAGDEARRGVDLLLAIEGIEQRGADVLDRCRQRVEPIAVLAGQRRRRHVQVAGEMERHGAVQQAARRLDRTAPSRVSPRSA